MQYGTRFVSDYYHPFGPIVSYRDQQPLNPNVRRDMRELERKFSNFVTTTFCSLRDSNIDVEAFKVFVTEIAMSHQESIPYINHHLADVIHVSAFDKMFPTLRHNGMWDFLNFIVLEEVVGKFGDEKLKAEMEKYCDDIEAFRQNTKLTDFLRVWDSRTPDGFYPGCVPVVAKFNLNWPECTLADVAEKEALLASEFNVRKLVFRLSNAIPGSVCLMWLIPKPAIRLMKRAIEEGKSNLWALDIQKIWIDGKLMYNVCDTLH